MLWNLSYIADPNYLHGIIVCVWLILNLYMYILTERLQELKIKWASPEQTNMDSTYEATLEGKSCHCFG